jgi:hypothetical protein
MFLGLTWNCPIKRPEVKEIFLIVNMSVGASYQKGAV